MMTPERWQKVRDVLEQALELAPEKRGRFLDVACSSDPCLRSEVQSLLSASDDAPSSFLESPPLSPVALAPGTKLGEYQIISQIGSGGMGVVYRARDSRLDRDVAIKVLPVHLSSDPDRLKRFEQEAKSAAALNHPNILAVYQLGTYQGAPYLVSELLEGETLREELKQGALPQQLAMDYAEQIADGLNAAHERGIIHRDLKPENLFVTKDNRLKILDFGLAKLALGDSESAEKVATIGLQTHPGMIAGTVGYMSPEQVRGEKLDVRTDLFSFGVVLYEMATGKRPFDGDTSDVTFEAILNRQPTPPTEFNSKVSCGLESIISKALEKDRELRHQHASDIRTDLQRLKRDTESGRLSSVASPGTSHLGIRRKLAILVVLAVVALAGVAYFYFHRTPKLTDKDTIVLADFDNKTGDTVFDDALRQALAVELGQSPFLNVLPDRKVSETLQMMGRPANQRITADVGRELCLRTSSKAVLGGTISSLGNHYLIDLNAVACSTGDTLDKEQGEAASKEDVLKVLSQASSTMRTKLGESLPSVQKFDVPIEATTSSLEALKTYSIAVTIMREKGDAPSIPFFKRASELDPNFPLAYAALSTGYGNLGQPSLALEYARKAYQLRDRVTEREKLRITAVYFGEGATGELDKWAQTYQLWVANYPRDYLPHLNLGDYYGIMGQDDKALTELQEALHLEPNAVMGYVDLGATYLELNRFDDAKATFDQALARKRDSGMLRCNIYALAFLRGDAAQMEQQVAWGAGKPGDEEQLLSTQSDTEAYYGRLNKARDYSRRAVDSAVRSDSKETAASYQVNAAQREAELGNAALARQGVAAALALFPGRNVKVVAALTLARTGDASRAKALVGELQKNYPLNTMLKLYYLPTINAAIEFSRGNSSQAIMDLEATAPYELGGTIIQNLYPAYVRGQAYLLAHNGTAAAAEFQKLLDHRGIVVNFVTGSLAHLQIGRAYAMAGDTAKAKAAYNEFLTLWKDADPDIPTLIAAKSEYAKLH